MLIATQASSHLTKGFPLFEDGNVEIRLSRKPEDRFVLHSVVLSLHSPWFRASFSERWAGSDSAQSSSSSEIKWRYELRFDANEGNGLLMRAVGPII